MTQWLQVTPTFGENAVTGAIPGAWVGQIEPDGTRDEWLLAPIGSIYLYKPNETDTTKYYKKRSNNGRADDWAPLAGFHVIQQRFTKAQMTDGGGLTGTIVLTEQIPVGAWVFQTLLQNVIAFSGDTTATIQVGDGTTVARYSTGTPSVFAAAAAIDVGVPSGTKIHVLAKSVTVTITGTADFTNISALGAATIEIFYLL